MSKVQIFDPAMCCSTGVCGPGVDPELLRVATIINSLQKLGKDIERYNLSDNPQIYVDHAVVNQILNQDGIEALPVTLLDGKVVKKSGYPSNEELMEWTGTRAEELLSLLVKEEMDKQGNNGCCCGSGSKCC